MELAIPHLRILDYEQAIAFYVDALGFQIDFEHRSEPHLPVYMGISRGTLSVHLSEHEGSGPPGDGRGLTLAVRDVDDWHRRLRAKGIPFERDIEDQPWGSRDFIVHDPFENVIAVVSRIA